MKSIDKKQKLDLLKADAKKLLSTDLVRIKGGIVPGSSFAEPECTFCKGGCATCAPGGSK